MEERKIGNINVNRILVAINVILFFILEILGDTEDAAFLYRYGAMHPGAVLLEGEWYRLFTCMFLHFGIQHLGNNMILLFFLGDYLEDMLGHTKYLLLYLLSGFSGSVVSMVFLLKQQEYVVSAGASGAVYGVIGALLYVVLRNKGRLENLTVGRLFFMIILSLYHGFTATGIDNFAHMGGLISGFLLSVLLYRKRWREFYG